MRIDILDDWSGVAALEPEWNDLLHESHADSIFMTWEWVRCWAELVQTSARPLVVSVRDACGTLLGVAPLYYATLRLGHAMPYRLLRIMGDFPTGGDYPDWIIRRGREDEIAEVIVDVLGSRRDWDFLWMSNMAGWTGAHQRIVTACRARNVHCRIRPHECSAFELPGDGETYFRSLSKNKRQQLRAEMKRVLADPAVEICRCDSEEQLPEFLEALFELHASRWAEKRDSGVFNRRPLEAAFYRRFTPVALKQGWLRFYGLRDHGALKAVQIGYVYRNVFHQLQEGFDPAYAKGAGNVLRAKVIEACIAEGIEAYDFLGDATEHKRRWLGQTRVGYDVFAGRPTMKNRFVFNLFMAGMSPSGRFMPQVRPPVGALPVSLASIGTV